MTFEDWVGLYILVVTISLGLIENYERKKDYYVYYR